MKNLEGRIYRAWLLNARVKEKMKVELGKMSGSYTKLDFCLKVEKYLLTITAIKKGNRLTCKVVNFLSLEIPVNG